MITTYNIRTLWIPLYNWWMNNVGGGKHPEHIYYFRDGVSEGQYMHVLEQEVKDMKKCLAQKYGEAILVRLHPSFEMLIFSQPFRRMLSLRWLLLRSVITSVSFPKMETGTAILCPARW